MTETTLSILKPDVTRRNLTGKINSIIEESGLRIVAQKRLILTKNIAAAFYQEHEGKPFFDNLVKHMTAGPIVVQVLQADNAIALYRQLMGATDPSKADEGTLRQRFAQSIDMNSVHGSDSPTSAKREVSFFFSDIEIVG